MHSLVEPAGAVWRGELRSHLQKGTVLHLLMSAPVHTLMISIPNKYLEVH